MFGFGGRQAAEIFIVLLFRHRRC